jgi:hypothetical protein
MLQYNASTSLTITGASLGSGSARSSAVVTSSTTANLTAVMLTVNITSTTTLPSGNKQVVVYGYMSEDGTNYSSGSLFDNVDGTDKAVTIGSPTNLFYLGTVQLNITSGAVQTFREVFEVTRIFGCVPPKWGIVLYNDSGTALGTTVSATYREVYYN